MYVQYPMLRCETYCVVGVNDCERRNGNRKQDGLLYLLSGKSRLLGQGKNGLVTIALML